MKMFHSIRWRIAVPYFFLILTTLGALGLYMSGFVRQAQLDQLERELTSEALLLSDFWSQLQTGNTNPGQWDDRVRAWSQNLGARVTLITADGVVIGESHQDRTQMENHLNRPEVQQALAEGSGASMRFSRTIGFQMMYVAVPVIKDGDLLGFARVALPLEEIEANVQQLENAILISTLLAGILTIVIAFAITQYTTRPLRKLTKAVQTLAMDGSTQRLVPPTNDEVGQLTRAFNIMGVQLRKQFSDLERERGKLAAVLERMTDGVLIVDEKGEVQLINPAAERIFGISADDALGDTVASVLRHHQIVDLWQQSQDTGEGQLEAVEISTRNMFLQVVVTPLEKALPGGTLLLFQDLTHVKHLETVRRDFISNISHEIRTPLASLKALTETLQEGALEDPPAAQRFLARIETEVDSLALIVQELLELSRIESGRVPLQLKIISPLELIQNAVERLSLQAERAGLDLSIGVPENVPHVLADPSRMEQVIVNLLHNAIKFTPEAGKISLTANRHNGKVRFAVEDTGIGIAPQDLPRIFERFYKTDKARAGGGTGLGLSISRHIVEAHGGRIWAESEEGQGSKFYFTVPVARS